MDIKIGKKSFIRNIGKDEYWLQDLIYNDPSILGLGALQPVNKEKKQSSGGRLDILLKDPQDNTMYEIELMLGETDPSHIIRSIEYWDNEKRKYPQRQHFAVLIAESFDRRYFNIVQIMSLNIPMIAIQADLLEVNSDHILNFNKILDVYIEPEDEEETIVNESSWADKSKWTLDSAKEFVDLLASPDIKLNYTQSYISIIINGRNAYCLDKRTKPTSIMWFNVKDDEKADSIKILLNNASIVFSYNRYKDFAINIDVDLLKQHKSVFQKINEARYKQTLSEE
ncbi:MAG TPA: hypothetical protein VMU29_10440 [Smithella sp.]|nr:hypothetical protein [Smithella sp.]